MMGAFNIILEMIFVCIHVHVHRLRQSTQHSSFSGSESEKNNYNSSNGSEKKVFSFLCKWRAIIFITEN